MIIESQEENDMGVYIELPKEWAKWSLEVTDVHDNILEAKTTDIDLVRCGECKHWNEETHGCNRNPSVNAWWETDFCNYGERKE